MNQFSTLTLLTYRWALRDRIMVAVLAVALFVIMLVPMLSLFSMRQVQELAITLSLSTVSLFLMMLAVLLGSSSIWRDIERRYTAAVLTLPVSRNAFILARFCGLALFIVSCAVILGAGSAIAIKIAAWQHPSDIGIHWLTVLTAVGADTLKAVLLAALALLLSSVGTSYFLPFFATLAIYFAGNSSQDVYEFVTGPYGKQIPKASVALIKLVYYLLPNLSAFNYKLQAIYGLPVTGLPLTLGYFVVYTGLLLLASVMIFSRRQLP